MGLLVICMNFINDIWLAVPFLIVLGGLGGYLVVPMNALLQHRGHNLMGAGRSIAVQNFNEQACILGLGVLYSLFTKLGLSALWRHHRVWPAGGGQHVADPALAHVQLPPPPPRGGTPAAHRAAGSPLILIAVCALPAGR